MKKLFICKRRPTFHIFTHVFLWPKMKCDKHASLHLLWRITQNLVRMRALDYHNLDAIRKTAHTHFRGIFTWQLTFESLWMQIECKNFNKFQEMSSSNAPSSIESKYHTRALTLFIVHKVSQHCIPMAFGFVSTFINEIAMKFRFIVWPSSVWVDCLLQRICLKIVSKRFD